jgi:putative tricarboxylic transport membrane protein
MLHGFAVALQPGNLAYTLLGCLLGTVIGVLPGLGPAAGIALLLPITFGLEPTSALIMLAGIYYGAMYGGSTTSILINTPGESAAVMTTLDGYQMARRGRAGAALAVSAIGSFIAGTISVVLLSLFAVPFSEFALHVGPAEFFTLLLFSMCSVAALTGKSLARGIFSLLLGLVIATVGIDLQSGMPRFTGGHVQLLDGVPFLIAAVGMFALSEVFINLETHLRGKSEVLRVTGPLWLTRDELRRSIGPILRGTGIGFVKGLLPGGGATIATILSYSLERSLSKHPEQFGKGMIEGVAGPEAANNAAVSGNLVPLLTLGLPSGGTTAILLGAFIMFGIQPGPMLMQQHPELVWSVIQSMYIGNLALLVLNLPLVFIFVRLLYIPAGLMLPGIIVIASIGIYSINNSVFDLWLMLAFGVLGYAFRKFQIPAAPLVLAMVLGNPLEQSLRQGLTISDGSALIFVASPIGMTFVALSAGILILSFVMHRRRALRHSST